jgi:hypothetical protein
MEKIKVRKKVRSAVIGQLMIECQDPDLKSRFHSSKASILINSENLKYVKEDWVTVLSSDVLELIKLVESPVAIKTLSEEVLLMIYATLVYFEKDDDVIPDYSLLFKGLKDDAVAITYVISVIKKTYPVLAGQFRFSDGIVEEVD